MQALIALEPIIFAVFFCVILMALMALLLFIGDRINNKGDKDDKTKD